MKGSPKLPSCGFSAQARSGAFQPAENVLPMLISLQNPDIRAELPKYANSRHSQLWVDGELVGRCDIVIEMYQRGELQQLIKNCGKI